MDRIPDALRERLLASGRYAQGESLLEFIRDAAENYVAGHSETEHIVIYAPCQAGKSDFHTLALIGGYLSRVFHSSVTKGRQCAMDLTYTKLREKCPPQFFNVECFKSSKHSAKSVKERRLDTSWVLFAGEAQFRHFLEGLESLQACRPAPEGVHGWLVVLDESDAYQE